MDNQTRSDLFAAAAQKSANRQMREAAEERSRLDAAAKEAAGAWLALTEYEAAVLRMSLETEIAALRRDRTLSEPVVHQLAALASIRDRIDAATTRKP